MGHDEAIDFKGVDPNLVHRVLIHDDNRDLRGRVIKTVSKYSKYNRGVISILIVAADQDSLSDYLDKLDCYPNHPSLGLTFSDFIKKCYRELGIDY